MTNGPTLAHVPTALSLPGDTLVTVAAQLAKARRAAGGVSVTVMSDNRDLRDDASEVLYVDYTRYCARQYFVRRELAVDVASGALGLRRPYYGRLLLPAVEAVRARDVDAVLVYEGHYAAASLPWWSELRPRTKVLLYVHNPLSRTYTKLELCRLFRQCDGVVFVADHLRRDAEARLGGALVPFRVVLNGVEELFFCDKEPRAQPTGTFDVVFAGRTVPEKGPHVLLEAVALAQHDTAVPLRAIIVGSRTYRSTESLSDYEHGLRKLAAERGVDAVFTPFVDKDRLREIYRSASAVSVPSVWSEPFGLVAAEALAAGAPLIASRTPGLIEVAGDAALYAAPGDAVELAAQIAKLANDPVERARLRVAAQPRARTLSWARADEHLARLVDELRMRRR